MTDLQISGLTELVSSEIIVAPAETSIDEAYVENVVRLASEADDFHGQENLQLAAVAAPDLASVKAAAMQIAAVNPMTPVRQRINSRQATASRVSFDDPLDDKPDDAHLKQNCGESPATIKYNSPGKIALSPGSL